MNSLLSKQIARVYDLMCEQRTRSRRIERLVNEGDLAVVLITSFGTPALPCDGFTTLLDKERD